MNSNSFFSSFSKKTLLYNLIFFDFILLETSSRRISFFFLEKIQKKKNYLYRLELFQLLQSFKQFLKLFRFIKNIKFFQKKLIYIFSSYKYIFEFFKLFFKNIKLSCLLNLNYTLPKINNNIPLKSILIINDFLLPNKFFSLIVKKILFIQSVNSSFNNDFSTYKIFTNLNDYKKLIFFCLIIVSIFKKSV